MVSRQRRNVPIAGVVVLLAFVVGYFLPDLLGGSAASDDARVVGASAPVSAAVVSATGQPARPEPPTAVPTPSSAGAPPAGAAPSPAPRASAGPIVTATVAPAGATATPTAPPPTATPRTHVVQAGDNLWDIAERYGVTVEAIVDANRLSNPEALKLDQKLIIPTPAARSE